MVVPRGWGREHEEIFNGCGVLILQNEEHLEMDGGVKYIFISLQLSPCMASTGICSLPSSLAGSRAGGLLASIFKHLGIPSCLSLLSLVALPIGHSTPYITGTTKFLLFCRLAKDPSLLPLPTRGNRSLSTRRVCVWDCSLSSLPSPSDRFFSAFFYSPLRTLLFFTL